MSDERDETRHFVPFDDATRADDLARDGDPAPEGGAAGRADGTVSPDETVAEPGLVPPVRDDATVAEPGLVPPVRDDAAVVRPRPDATSVMPAADDWAPGRGNAAWTGRAEVRAPRPGSVAYQEDDWPTSGGRVPREPRDRWWMPIVVGIVALVLLGALGWGIYLIMQNSGGDGTAPTATTPAAPSAATTTTATTAPTTEPTTPSPTPSTTEPTTSEVTIPALKGLALADARSALGSMGLSYRLIYREVDAPPDTVIDSDPAEGQEVPPDTVVTLVVAKQAAATTPTTPATTATTAAPGPNGN